MKRRRHFAIALLASALVHGNADSSTTQEAETPAPPAPTESPPTAAPTLPPTAQPSSPATAAPTIDDTVVPTTVVPTHTPTALPTSAATGAPTRPPTVSPTEVPTATPTQSTTTTTTLPVPTALTRRMILVYEESVLNENCDPLLQSSMSKSIAQAVNAANAVANSSSSAWRNSSYVYSEEDVIYLAVYGCPGNVLMPARPSDTAHGSSVASLTGVGQPVGYSSAGQAEINMESSMPTGTSGGRRLVASGQAVVVDWTIVSPSGADAQSLASIIVDQSDSAHAFKERYASYFNELTGHTFFENPVDDIALQQIDGCLANSVHCSGDNDATRDPETCLFSDGSFLGSEAACSPSLSDRVNDDFRSHPYVYVNVVLAILVIAVLGLVVLTYRCLAKPSSGEDSEDSGEESSFDDDEEQNVKAVVKREEPKPTAGNSRSISNGAISLISSVGEGTPLLEGTTLQRPAPASGALATGSQPARHGASPVMLQMAQRPQAGSGLPMQQPRGYR